MKKHADHLISASVLGLYLLGGWVSAAPITIFNTLGSSPTSPTLITGGTNRATLGSYFDLKGATATIDSATLNLRGTSGGGSIPWLAGLFSSSLTSNVPTTWVADLATANATTSTLANVVFTAASPISLAADYRYWLIFANVSNGLQGQIDRAATAVDSILDPHLTFGQGFATSNQTTTAGLTTLQNITLPSSFNSTPTVLFSLNGTVTPVNNNVPEPSTIALMGLGLMVMLRTRKNAL